MQETVAAWFPKYELPLLSERVKCLRELGNVLNQGASERFHSHVTVTLLLNSREMMHFISNHLVLLFNLLSVSFNAFCPLVNIFFLHRILSSTVTLTMTVLQILKVELSMW